MQGEKKSIEHYLLNREFKEWVLNPNPNNQIFWKKWIEAHPEELSNIHKARQILLSSQHKEAETVSEEEKSEVLKAILGHRAPVKRKKYWPLGIAASILLAVTSLIFYLPKKLTKEKKVTNVISKVIKSNPMGRKSKIVLPDGSKVWLNSDSRIEYPSEFGEERLVNLKGEAFFEVRKDKKKLFRVNSGGIITTALGTSFNINAFEEDADIQVKLVTGKVTVTDSAFIQNTDSALYITPGEQVSFNKTKRSLKKSKFDPATSLLWKEGIIAFSQDNFDTIKKTLERWYGVNIQVKNLNKKISYTGQFNNQSLEKVLERMAFTERFTFKINKNHVELKFE
ncbi:FecR family protein [Fulvivirga sediminis]|uniref:FecR domain-containing protein n=1 Tax=Fulvivirga sediminis TaxID=2803949 RepID=A0A937F6P0_9BACT|nr:FecR family protein [Fulvivirga sediminis]MBL3655249.1 FecR domain-containing protein [Fulvivirga sediminis]